MDGEIYLSSMYRLIVTMPNTCVAYFLFADFAPWWGIVICVNCCWSLADHSDW